MNKLRCFLRHGYCWGTKGLFCLFTIGMSISAIAGETINTLAVVQRTLSALPSCLHYRVTGLCYWTVCDPICRAKTTFKVEHYLPDAVASVYRGYGHNAWYEANQVIDSVAYQAGDQQVNSVMKAHLGYGNETTSSPYEQDTHFKEVDVIGNPAIVIFKRLTALLIGSNAKAFMPYYTSLADAYMWRTPFMEMSLYPQFLLPGSRIVGSLINNWGSIYPRTGFLVQPADTKAAAVIATRAADIATRLKQPHVYRPLPSGSCGSACKVDEAQENNANTQWQMIYPLEETTCQVFGKNDLMQLTPWGGEASERGNGNYVWIMWRRYHGCIQTDGKYLGNISFK